MDNQCYYCEQIFSSKEKLYDHLEEHSRIQEKQEKEKPKKQKKAESGESELSEQEIMEQFTRTKSGEPARMSSRSKSN